MARTKRAQLLMEPAEYRRLEEAARERGVAVAELIRTAVRERYLLNPDERRRLVDDILSMEVPTGEWERVEEEIAEAHGHGVR